MTKKNEDNTRRNTRKEREKKILRKNREESAGATPCSNSKQQRTPATP